MNMRFRPSFLFKPLLFLLIFWCSVHVFPVPKLWPRSLQTNAVMMARAAAESKPITQPDLLITSIVLSPTLAASAIITGQPSLTTTVDIIITVKNQGDASASTGFGVYLYVEPADTPPVSTTLATGYFSFALTLEPHTTFIWTRTGYPLTMPLTTTLPQIVAWVDPPWENRVEEANEHNNLFPDPNAAITHIEPHHARRGETLAITLTATNTHFASGITQIDMGAGITVAASTVISAQQVVAQVQIAADAALTTRPVTVTSGVERLVAPTGFQVQPLSETVSNTATIHGLIDLAGRPPKPHPAWAIPLMVEIQPITASTPTRWLVTSNEEGRFSLAEIPVGVYRIRLKGNHTLANQIEQVALSEGLHTLYFGSLLEGDVETEKTGNRVVVSDFSLLSGAFHHCVGDAEFLHNADLNEVDDCVTIEDAALLLASFNTQGDVRFASPDRVPAPIPLRISRATLAFTSTEMSVPFSTTVALPLYADPQGGDAIIGVTGHYQFDPSQIEVLSVTVSEHFPQRLAPPSIDHIRGVIQFSAAARPGEWIERAVPVATFWLRLKNGVTAAAITPLLGRPQASNVAGENGSILASASGVMLIGQGAPEGERRQFYLPVIVR